MTVFLHIGDSRTGTTSFQSLLSANRERLWEMGIDYPPVGLLSNGRGVAQHLLSFSILETWPDFALRAKISRDDAWGSLTEHLRKTQEDGKLLLLSSEAFSSAKRDGIEFVKKYFEGHTVVPIFVHRDPVEWRRSMREHNIARGVAVQELTKYATSTGPQHDLGLKKLNRWQEFFDVKVFEYGPMCHAEILSFVGTDIEELEAVETRNQQPDKAVTKLLNRLNKIEMKPENRKRFNEVILKWARNHPRKRRK